MAEAIPFHLQPIVEAILVELRRQNDDDRMGTGPYLDADYPEDAIIDGHVDLVALARAVAFCPIGDNHHNAAKCPHCNPGAR